MHTLVIPGWTPALLNRLLRVHWSDRKKALACDADMVALYWRTSGLPAASCRRRVGVACTYARGGRLPDPDGLLKSLLDALVKCGALVDDSALWCELGRVEVRRGERRETVVTLEDLP